MVAALPCTHRLPFGTIFLHTNRLRYLSNPVGEQLVVKNQFKKSHFSRKTKRTGESSRRKKNYNSERRYNQYNTHHRPVDPFVRLFFCPSFDISFLSRTCVNTAILSFRLTPTANSTVKIQVVSRSARSLSLSLSRALSASKGTHSARFRAVEEN